MNTNESDAALPSAEEMLRDSVPLNRPPANEVAVPTPGAYFYEGLGWQNSGHSWLLASGDGFGMFSIGDMNLGLRKSPSNHGDLHWAIYWLNGPTTTDMPPRLFDLALTWSEQHQVTDNLSLQYTISAGFYSDFRASAREGVRFPGWFVFRYGATESRQWILGIDILDRRDVFCLPVGGVVLAPTENLRMEFVFPRPRLMWRPYSKRWLYVRGEMGGGTWSIDRTTGNSDLATYRDLRALVGVTSDPEGMGLGSLEVGYVFDRSLDYRSGVGDYEPHNAWVIQTVCSF